MRAQGMVGWLLGLGLILSPAVSAQEPPVEPVLVAHAATLDHTGLHSHSAALGAASLKKEKENAAQLFVLSLWSREKAVARAANAAALPATPRASAPPAPSPERLLHQLAFGAPKHSPPSQTTPLPRNLPRTTFTHSRLRGPFEQIYPRF